MNLNYNPCKIPSSLSASFLSPPLSLPPPFLPLSPPPSLSLSTQFSLPLSLSLCPSVCVCVCGGGGVEEGEGCVRAVCVCVCVCVCVYHLAVNRQNKTLIDYFCVVSLDFAAGFTSDQGVYCFVLHLPINIT